MRSRAIGATLWLAVLLTGTLRHWGPSWWPASPGGMFAFGASETHLLFLDGTDVRGIRVGLPAASFGLNDVELTNQIERAAGRSIGFDDRPLLAELAAHWNKRHPGRPVTSITLHVRRILLRDGFRPIDATVLQWRQPGTSGAP